ncbi:MAG: hypothetical protein LC660_16035 [Desulfobacteraceae bacterium]|nr:hypothetical protein [Desulfobacteraceae bacterium]
MEKKSTDISDLVKLAAVVVKKLNDTDWAADLLAKATEKCTTMKDYTFVAGAFIRLLGDREKAAALYETAEAQCTDKTSYSRLITLVHGQTTDTSFVTRMLISARQKLNGFEDLLFLAQTALALPKDKQMAAQIYAQAEEKANDTHRLSRLATSLESQMKDSAWASRVLRKIA